MSVENVDTKTLEQRMALPSKPEEAVARDHAHAVAGSAGTVLPVVHESNAGIPAEQSEKGLVIHALT